MERYGLFKRLADGAPIWVCGQDDLAIAIAAIKELDRKTGLEHFIHDFRDGIIVVTSRNGNASANGRRIREPERET